MEQRLSKTLLFALILTVFLDISNFFMPVPIYTPLFLHTSFLAGFPHASRMIMLGILVACFGAAQLIGGPILGELSDQRGRKKILLLALTSSMIGTVLGGISLSTGSVPLIYISRLIIGFSSGTIGITYAVAADYSSGHQLAKNIGYISFGPCLAAAFAPIIGGHLASNPHLDIFGYATPFYFMTLLYLSAILLLWKMMPMDTAKRAKMHIHPFTGFTNIITVVKRSSILRRMVVMAIFFQLGTEGFFLSFPIVAVKEFHMSSAMIGNHFLLFAIGSSISTLWLNNHLSKHFKSTHIYLVCILIMLVGIIFGFLESRLFFWLAFLFFAIGGMLCWVHTNNIFSKLVDETEQGLIMGVSQAMWSIGGLVSSIIIGLIASVHYEATGILLVLTELASFVMMFMVIAAMRRKKITDL